MDRREKGITLYFEKIGIDIATYQTELKKKREELNLITLHGNCHFQSC